MKKSELKKSIKEEIFDILEDADKIRAQAGAQAELNKELEKTAKITKSIPDLSESLNPEVSKTLDRFIKAMAKRYGYSEQDAVFAIMAALKQRDFDGVNEGNDSDKFQDDGYVDKKDVDDTTNLYVHSGGEDMAFESVNEEDEDDMDKQASKAAKKGDSISKIASKLQQTTKEMKTVVKKWKTSEGAEKEKLTDRLRELTKIKKELEGLL